MSSQPQRPQQPVDYDQRRMAFVTNVMTICETNPGDRAALRVGLRTPLLDLAARTRRAAHSAGTLPVDEDRRRAYYTVAAMIASTPRKNHTGLDSGAPGRDLGQCLADAVLAKSLKESSAETSLVRLVKQSTSGLHRHLPATIGQLTSQLTAADWARLLSDLERWPTYRRNVADRWQESFYRTILNTSPDNADPDDKPAAAVAAA